MTRRRLLRELDSYELSEWMVVYQLEPFGPAQEDLRAGYLASLFYNANKKKTARALKPQDFFPSLKVDETEQDPEQIKLYLEALTVALGGEVRRK